MKPSELGSEGTAHSCVTGRTASSFWRLSLDYIPTPRLETAIARSRSGNRKRHAAATFIVTSSRRNTRPLHQRKLGIGGMINMRVCHQLKRTRYTLSAERLFHCGRDSKPTKKPDSAWCV